MTTTSNFRCGTIAILGRPNVGKSTLLNTILTEKVSIVTPKPQTTRQKILGIVPGPGYQAIFIDTPGFHQFKKKLNQAMVEAALSAIGDADLVLVLVDASDPVDEFSDPHGAGVLVRRCEEIGRPVFLMLNKVDRLPDKKELLPMIERWSAFSPAVKAVIPLSAAKGEGVKGLLVEIYSYLPEGPALYPEDDLTDQSERAISAEIIRETCIFCLREELPYATAVAIERFTETAARRTISAVIWVERESQKAIVIGKRGAMIRRIGSTAREQLIARFGVDTNLFLEVRVHPDWTDDPASLRELGYQP